MIIILKLFSTCIIIFTLFSTQIIIFNLFSTFNINLTLFSTQIVILKLRQNAVSAVDHDRRHWKAGKVTLYHFSIIRSEGIWRQHWTDFLTISNSQQALIFVMPLLGFGHVLTLSVNPTVRSIGVPIVVAVSDAMEAVIMSTQLSFKAISLSCYHDSDSTAHVSDHVHTGERVWGFWVKIFDFGVVSCDEDC